MTYVHVESRATGRADPCQDNSAESIADRLRRHQPEVLAELLTAHARSIQAVAFAILGDLDDAEEVLVDTLLSALEHGHQLRNDDSLRPWLLKIAANQALAFRRKRWRLVPFNSLSDHPAGQIRHVEASLDLNDSLANLPKRTRAALVLRYYAELSVEEIAHAMGTSTNTAKSQLRVGLHRLRGDLSDEHDSKGGPI